MSHYRRFQPLDIVFLIALALACIVAYALTAQGQSVPEIKLRTQQHLLAQQRLTATQQVGPRRTQVAYYDGGQRGLQVIPIHGLYPHLAWWVVRRDSQVWRWQDASNSSTGNVYFRYTYSDTCGWTEAGRLVQVACDGEVYTDGLDVRRITQHLHTAKWGLVTLDINYEWVQLSERRLVPTTMTITTTHQVIQVTWANYHEYRATEPVVREIDDDETVDRAVDAGGLSVPDVRHVDGYAVVPVEVSVGAGGISSGRLDLPVERHVGLLTLPRGAEIQTVSVKRPWWHHLLLIPHARK